MFDSLAKETEVGTGGELASWGLFARSVILSSMLGLNDIVLGV